MGMGPPLLRRMMMMMMVVGVVVGVVVVGMAGPLAAATQCRTVSNDSTLTVAVLSSWQGAFPVLGAHPAVVTYAVEQALEQSARMPLARLREAAGVERIRWVWHDVQCEAALATKVAVDLLFRCAEDCSGDGSSNAGVDAIIGPGCDSAVESVAHVAAASDPPVPVFAWYSGSDHFQDTDTFPNLVRMTPPFSVFADPFVAIMDQFGWDTFVLLHATDAEWDTAARAIADEADSQGYKVALEIGFESFLTAGLGEKTSILEDIAADGTQVILVLAGCGDIREMMLEADTQGMLKGYAWISAQMHGRCHDSSLYDWPFTSDSVARTAMRGMLSMNLVQNRSAAVTQELDSIKADATSWTAQHAPPADGNVSDACISCIGVSTDTYTVDATQAADKADNKEYAALLYDAVDTFARAFNESCEAQIAAGGPTGSAVDLADTVRDFTFAAWDGLSGSVSFDSNGDREHMDVQVRNMLFDSSNSDLMDFEALGVWDSTADTMIWNSDAVSSTIWSGGKSSVPSDTADDDDTSGADDANADDGVGSAGGGGGNGKVRDVYVAATIVLGCLLGVVSLTCLCWQQYTVAHRATKIHTEHGALQPEPPSAEDRGQDENADEAYYYKSPAQGHDHHSGKKASTGGYIAMHQRNNGPYGGLHEHQIGGNGYHEPYTQQQRHQPQQQQPQPTDRTTTTGDARDMSDRDGSTVGAILQQHQQPGGEAKSRDVSLEEQHVLGMHNPVHSDADTHQYQQPVGAPHVDLNPGQRPDGGAGLAAAMITDQRRRSSKESGTTTTTQADSIDRRYASTPNSSGSNNPQHRPKEIVSGDGFMNEDEEWSKDGRAQLETGQQHALNSTPEVLSEVHSDPSSRVDPSSPGGSAAAAAAARAGGAMATAMAASSANGTCNTDPGSNAVNSSTGIGDGDPDGDRDRDGHAVDGSESDGGGIRGRASSEPEPDQHVRAQAALELSSPAFSTHNSQHPQLQQDDQHQQRSSSTPSGTQNKTLAEFASERHYTGRESKTPRTNSRAQQLRQQAEAEAEAMVQSHVAGMDEKGQQIFKEIEIDASEIEMGAIVGAGSFAEVRRAQYQGMTVAVKGLKVMDKRNLDRFLSEILLLKGLRHPNVVQLLGASRIEGRVVMVSEYIENGTLADVLNNAQVELRWLPLKLEMACDIARAMQYLHSARYYDDFTRSYQTCIVHRDLKPQNMLVTKSWGIKITDFGEARTRDTEYTMTQVGTLLYIAPEIVRGDRYDEKVDVYSFGVVLLAMLQIKRNMFELFAEELANTFRAGERLLTDGTTDRNRPHVTPYAITTSVVNDNLRPVIPNWVCESLATLIQNCWHSNPSSRPPFSEIAAFLDQVVREELEEGAHVEPPRDPLTGEVVFDPSGGLSSASGRTSLLDASGGEQSMGGAAASIGAGASEKGGASLGASSLGAGAEGTGNSSYDAAESPVSGGASREMDEEEKARIVGSIVAEHQARLAAQAAAAAVAATNETSASTTTAAVKTPGGGSVSSSGSIMTSAPAPLIVGTGADRRAYSSVNVGADQPKVKKIAPIVSSSQVQKNRQQHGKFIRNSSALETLTNKNPELAARIADLKRRQSGGMPVVRPADDLEAVAEGDEDEEETTTNTTNSERRSSASRRALSSESASSGSAERVSSLGARSAGGQSFGEAVEVAAAVAQVDEREDEKAQKVQKADDKNDDEEEDGEIVAQRSRSGSRDSAYSGEFESDVGDA